MHISTKGRYGLRLLLTLAQCEADSRTVSLKRVSQKQGISEKYLWQVAHELKRAGLVKAERGPRGGYRLARKPEEVSLREILTVLEGKLSLVECTNSPKICSRSRSCAARSVWQELEDRLNEAMEGIKLNEVIERCAPGKGEGQAMTYVI